MHRLPTPEEVFAKMSDPPPPPVRLRRDHAREGAPPGIRALQGLGLLRAPTTAKGRKCRHASRSGGAADSGESSSSDSGFARLGRVEVQRQSSSSNSSNSPLELWQQLLRWLRRAS